MGVELKAIALPENSDAPSCQAAENLQQPRQRCTYLSVLNMGERHEACMNSKHWGGFFFLSYPHLLHVPYCRNIM